jgi:PadR family transcriptional regulator PadR
MRRTKAQLAVATALLTNPHGRHGYDLMQQTGLPSGAIYPILARLEDQGLVTSDWADPHGSYPRRRVYQLTDQGRAQLTELVEGR